ncbi:MAG: hypothetical protein DMF67_12015 [Acidobacteria bacterium]|nr:MAG: hypothetical protein DMF67_12015 [Acidobacteriota bacterium]
MSARGKGYSDPWANISQNKLLPNGTKEEILKRYYEPNFPVIKAEEHAEFEAVCQELAKRVADLFEKKRAQLERTFNKTDLAERGWAFSDITQYLYAAVQRGARELLEERGVLPTPEQHQNGVRWVFWAEEPSADADK